VLAREAITRMKTTLGNRLTDMMIKDTEPSDRPKRISDGRGMYLEVSPAGGRLWRLKFRTGGKETATSGEYQTIMSDQSEKLSSVSEASGVAPASRPL
jgi:hypothetical protein